MTDALPPIDVCSLCMAPRPSCACDRLHGLTLAKACPRWRSKAYLKFVRGLPCSVPGCQDGRVEAAHFGPRGAGQKVHDFLAIPLCSDHHRAHHAHGTAWEHYGDVMTWQLRTIAAAICAGVLTA